MFEVYCLTSPSGKRYVGITLQGADRRWRAHVNDAKRGSDCPLHRAIRKYGPKAFTRSLLERMTTEAGAKRAEQLWIKELGTFVDGYNATLGGDGTLGCRASLGKKRSSETCARIAEVKRGIPRSPETRAKLSAANLGKTISPEARAKIAEANRNRTYAPLSPEARAKMSAAKLGTKHAPETRAKMAESQQLRRAQEKQKREGI
jgi:group I intron endonuclease